MLPQQLLAHAIDRGAARGVLKPGRQVDGVSARWVGMASKKGQRVARGADFAGDLLQVDEIDRDWPRYAKFKSGGVTSVVATAMNTIKL